jgi:hypothetical protein
MYEYGKTIETRMMDRNEMFDYIRNNGGKMVVDFFSNWTDWINIERQFVIRERKFLGKNIVKKVQIKNIVKIEDEA